MSYLLHIGVLICIYVTLAYSLNLVMGFGGLLSLSHAAIYGIGAYSAALLLQHTDLGFPLVLLFAAVIAALSSLLLGVPSLRFRRDSFVLVTLSFQTIIYTVLMNWVSLTNGPFGISGIPRPVVLGATFESPLSIFLLAALLGLVSSLLLFRVYRSPYALALKALRDDEPAAESLGKPPFRYLLGALTIAGLFAGVAGALYATYHAYIDPSSFTLDESILLVAILILGGMGNRLGPLLGALFMVIVPEALRFVGLPDTIAGNIRQMIYGLLLILVMFYRPRGMAGDYAPK